jgi:hypothetical protein
MKLITWNIHPLSKDSLRKDIIWDSRETNNQKETK